LEINKLITSYKFAKLSNVVFSGVFTDNQIKELQLDNYKIIQNLEKFKHVWNISFELRENDTIFCKTEDIYLLFSLLKKVKLKNIKLITHQSDLSIDARLYRMKPKCISNWYSVNVSFKSNNLIPIPIGLANEHPKNLTGVDFNSKQIINHNIFFKDKKNLLYLNFQKNTNFKKRSGLYNIYEKFDWTLVENPISDKKYYISNLKTSSFVLVPQGNGIDTHRFWETLYSGSIPVIENNYAMNYSKNLPVLSVKNLKIIDKNYLIRKKQELSNQSFNFEKLYFKYWENLIKNNDVENNSTYLIKISEIKLITNENLFKIKNRYKSILKKILYYLRKLTNLKKSYFKDLKK